MAVEPGRSSDSTVEAWPAGPVAPRSWSAGRWLIGLAAAGLLAAGLALWSRHGDAVFTDVILAALAWCF